MSSATTGGTRHLEHDSFIYSSLDEYVETLAPLLRDVVTAGSPAIVAVSLPSADALRAALGPKATHLDFIDAAAMYTKPATTLDAFAQLLGEVPHGERMLVIGEVPTDQSAVTWNAWLRYEAAVNVHLAPYTARTICTYGQASVPPRVLAHLASTHPHLLQGQRRVPSIAYQEPAELAEHLPPTVIIPTRAPDLELTPIASLFDARNLFGRVAATAGFVDGHAAELTVGLNEILTNALRFRRTKATLRVWAQDGQIICLVRDDGPGADPLAGYVRPPLGAHSGYGIWLARQFFDHADVHGDAHGTDVLLSARPI